VHFYHLHALDWVDVTSALKADPAKTSSLAQSISNCEKSSATYFKGIQQRVKGVVDSGQLSVFASGYGGIPPTPCAEVNLLAVAHYLEALQFQKDFIRIHAILGARIRIRSRSRGRYVDAMDPNEPAAVINPETITLMRTLVAKAQKFVDDYYIPDVLAIAPSIRTGSRAGRARQLPFLWRLRGRRQRSEVVLFPRGIVMGHDISKVLPVDPAKITESVAHSWYDYSGGDAATLIRRRAKPDRSTQARSRRTIIST